MGIQNLAFNFKIPSINRKELLAVLSLTVTALTVAAQTLQAGSQTPPLPVTGGYKLVDKTVTITVAGENKSLAGGWQRLRYDSRITHPDFITDASPRLFSQPKRNIAQQHFKVVGCTSADGFNTGIGFVQVSDGLAMNYQGGYEPDAGVGSTTKVDPCLEGQSWEAYQPFVNGNYWAIRHKSTGLVLSYKVIKLPVGEENMMITLSPYQGSGNQLWIIEEYNTAVEANYNKFSTDKNIIGRKVSDPKGGYLGKNVSLIKRWLKMNGLTPVVWAGNLPRQAYDSYLKGNTDSIISTLQRNKVAPITNFNDLQKGDIVILGLTSHTGIATGRVEKERYQILEQNSPTGSPVKEGWYAKDNFYGAIRIK